MIGLMADGPGLGPAFLLPALALVAVLAFVPRFRTAPAPPPARDAASEGR